MAEFVKFSICEMEALICTQKSKSEKPFGKYTFAHFGWRWPHLSLTHVIVYNSYTPPITGIIVYSDFLVFLHSSTFVFSKSWRPKTATRSPVRNYFCQMLDIG